MPDHVLLAIRPVSARGGPASGLGEMGMIITQVVLNAADYEEATGVVGGKRFPSFLASSENRMIQKDNQCFVHSSGKVTPQTKTYDVSDSSSSFLA